MKNLILTILVIVSGICLTRAQTIPTTSRAAICDCLPVGWELFASGNNYSSNAQYVSPNNISWVPSLPAIPSGANTFISLFGGSVKAVITGLTAGQTYKFNYSVISAKTNFHRFVNGVDVDYSNQFSQTAVFRISNGSGIGTPITEHMITFNPDTEMGVWKSSTFIFKAMSSTASLFYDNPNGNESGFIGLDLGAPQPIVACNAGINQVPIKAASGGTAEIVCPATNVNLVTEFFGGLIPSGATLEFFDNPTHTGLPLSSVNVGKGTYYAFYFDATNQCYNTDYSTAKAVVTYKKCADLSPTVNIDALNFNPGVERDFIVNIFEKNGTSTSGNVSFRITKLTGFDITYPTKSGTSQVFGGKTNENGKWTFAETAQFITATSTSSILGKARAVVGFKIKRKANATAGLVQNMTPTVISKSGGEQAVDSANNQIITSVSTN